MKITVSGFIYKLLSDINFFIVPIIDATSFFADDFVVNDFDAMNLSNFDRLEVDLEMNDLVMVFYTPSFFNGNTLSLSLQAVVLLQKN